MTLLYKGTLRYSFEVCERCCKSRPEGDLIRKGCYSYAQHANAGKVLVTKVRSGLEIVRPFPQHAVSRIAENKWFVVCDGRRCSGVSRCCYAHSQAEADVWNTKLAARRGTLSGGRTYSTYPITVQQQPQPFVPVGSSIPAQSPVISSGSTFVEDNDRSWPDLPNVRAIKPCTCLIMQPADTMSLSVRACVCRGGIVCIVLGDPPWEDV